MKILASYSYARILKIALYMSIMIICKNVKLVIIYYNVIIYSVECKTRTTNMEFPENRRKVMSQSFKNYFINTITTY